MQIKDFYEKSPQNEMKSDWRINNSVVSPK